MKTCTKCEVEKDVESFFRNKNMKSGRLNKCKDCSNIQKKEWASDNMTRIRSYQKLYYHLNKDDTNKKRRESYKDNIADRRAKRQVYLDNNSDKIRETRLKYEKGNFDKLKAYQKIYNSSESCKKSRKKSRNKYFNAYKSRRYFSYHKSEDLHICSNCPEVNNIEAHHYDYNKPMDVTYLCKKCHSDWHRNNEPLNRISGIFTEGKK